MNTSKRLAAAAVLAALLGLAGASSSSAAHRAPVDPWRWNGGQTYATCGLPSTWYPECRTPRPLPRWATRAAARWGYSW